MIWSFPDDIPETFRVKITGKPAVCDKTVNLCHKAGFMLKCTVCLWVSAPTKCACHNSKS